MSFIQSTASRESTRAGRIFYGPRELRAGWRLLIFVAMVAALMAAGNLVVRKTVPDSGVASQLANKLVNIFAFLMASLVMGRIEGRSLGDYGLPWRQMFGARFWQGTAIGFVGVTALLGGMRAVGVFQLTGLALHGADVWKWAGLYAVAFFIVGLDEEFRFRGYLLFTATTGIGFWTSAVVLSALFGAGHISNSGETWVGALNAALGGLVFAGLLRRSGSLWLPIGVHAAWDWAQTYFYGVADSGAALPGHLFNSTFSGPVWLTGGSVGPEGSVLCTLLLGVIWLLCSAWLREARYPAPLAIAGRRQEPVLQT
jgi:uncharacterized protein